MPQWPGKLAKQMALCETVWATRDNTKKKHKSYLTSVIASIKPHFDDDAKPEIKYMRSFYSQRERRVRFLYIKQEEKNKTEKLF